MKSVDRPALSARVVRLIPLTEEGGRVYEQLAIIETVNGKVLAIFDLSMVITRDFVGKNMIFSLSAFMPHVEDLHSERYEIENWTGLPQVVVKFGNIPVSSSPGIHNPAISGKVLSVVGDNFILDVGVGTILVNYDLQLYNVKVGSFVRLADFRLDIVGDISAPC